MELNWNYAQAISDAGGVPVLIPPTADVQSIAELIDGWLIPGGRDIDPKEFGQELHPRAELQDPARFAIEKALYLTVDEAMPILGICYGCQFVNVVRGGTLQQHLPDILGESEHEGGTVQQYSPAAGSTLEGIVGSAPIEGKSYHHQAIETPAEGVRVVARHADGTIEAIEDANGRWVVGVQWHPERTLGDGASRKLFEAFVDAAKQFRDLKSRRSRAR